MLRRLLRSAAVTTALLVCSLSAYGESVRLLPGSNIVLEYNSTVFAEVVAHATFSLSAAGTQLIAVVDVVPQSTFLQQVFLRTDPALQATITSFEGYRSVTTGSPPAGYNFAFDFGGDPGLGDLATVTFSLSETLTRGLMIEASAVFVYGFRGDQVLQDTVSGAAIRSVPEPATVLLLSTGLGLCAARAFKRRRTEESHAPGPPLIRYSSTRSRAGG